MGNQNNKKNKPNQKNNQKPKYKKQKNQEQNSSEIHGDAISSKHQPTQTSVSEGIQTTSVAPDQNTCAGKTDKKSCPDTKNTNKTTTSQEQSKYVPSPYNFVPLNSFLVASEVESYKKEETDISEAYREFLLQEGKYSGYIETRIETLTPLYIEGSKGMFSNGKRICIPGSSLKGCLKNILKIYTNGAFRVGRSGSKEADQELFDEPDLSDRLLYYRSFASAFRLLRDEYSDNMMTEADKGKNGRSTSKNQSEAGFLVKKDKEYYICEARYDKVEVTDGTYYPESQIQWDSSSSCKVTIFPQYPNNKKGKYYYKVHSPLWERCYSIPEETLRRYVRDVERQGLALISLDKGIKDNLDNGYARAFNGYEFVIPCFYVRDGEVVKHFGATPYYRIPYNDTIGTHVPEQLKARTIDFAEAMFGFRDKWAGRIYVEDSYSEDNRPLKQYSETYAKPLLNPKPTSFQFYLCSDSNGNAQHWNKTGVSVKGYKQYWHKAVEWQRAADGQGKSPDNDKVLHKLAPVKEGQFFTGKIRFSQLSAVELGALLYFFKLGDEGGAYKLGMGKPLGLGSIKITGQLYLQEKEYYESLFDGDSFARGHVKVQESEVRENFIKAFLSYMKAQLDACNINAWSDHEKRMDTLRTMLDPSGIYLIESKEWEEATRYVDIGAGKGRQEQNQSTEDKLINERIPLPSVEDVAKKREGRKRNNR